MNKLKHISPIRLIRLILKWLTATRRRKILSSILAILIVITSIRFAFFNEPKQVKAAKMEILETNSTIQIDVANRYRATLEKTDTTEFIQIYDRAENDSNPDKVFRIAPGYVYDTSNYRLTSDTNRKTEVIEYTELRVKVRVEGKLMNSSGSDYLDDDADDDLTLTEEYTFTPDGVFASQVFDFKDGLTLGASDDIYIAFTQADITDAAHTDTVLFGDGETESSRSTTGTISNSNYYLVTQANNSYLDGFLGVTKSGWLDVSDGTGFYLFQLSGSLNQMPLYQDNINALVSGKHYSNWFYLFKDQTDLDTEAEREAVVNDYRNPDFLDFTTGSVWNDNIHGSTGLDFERSNDEYLYVADSSSLSITGDMTIEAWIKPESQSAAVHTIAAKWDGSSVSYLLNVFNDELRFYLDDGSEGATAYETTDAADLAIGNWYHVAAVYNATGQTATLYVNGTSEVSTTTGTIPSSIDDDADRFHIGATNSSTASTDQFDGVIDEVRVWNDQRTATEISNNMLTQVVSSEANLQAAYRLNENTGTTTFDETSNNNDLTLVNTPTWTTGYVPDQYNQTEGAYTINASSNHAEFDIDGGANVSTLINDVSVSAEDTAFDVDSTSGFPSSGVAYVEGDKFSYTTTDADTFSGIPTTGDLAIVGHADDSIVTLSSRHDPSFKLRGYRNNNVPTEAILEGERLQKDYDFLADIKPASQAYFAQDLVWYSPLESTTVNIGDNLTNNGCSFVTGKYGQALECDADNEYASVTPTNNIDFSKGALEFWLQPKTDHTIDQWQYYVDINNGSGDSFRIRKSDNDPSNYALCFVIDDGPSRWTECVDGNDYSWNAGDWVHIRVDWDENAANTVDKQKILINGVQPPSTDGGDYSSAGFSATTIDLSTNTSQECNCIIDEFKIYDFNGSGDQAELQQLASGGIGSNDYFGRDSNNYTFDFNDDDANNRGEYIWIGSDSRFTGVNLDLATDGVGTSLDFDWEYWTATQWAELTVTEQDSGASDWTGSGNFYWTDPGNWFPYSVNGSTDLYYIRGHLEGGSYTTDPIENTVKTDILLFQYTRHGGDITSENMTFEIPGWTSGAPPVAHWKFDAGYGTVAFDAMKGHDLTIKDAAWQEESLCISGKCLHYDGSEDMASRSAQLAELDFKETNSFTLSGWFRHYKGAGGTDTLISKYESSGSDGGYKVYIDSPDNLCFGIDDDNSSFPEDSACSPSSLADSKWHHFSAVKTGTTQIDLYVDGIRVGYDDNISASGTLENNDGFYIGADEGGYQNYWPGSVDEVKVYRYARGASEIKTDFTGGSQVFSDKTDWLSDGLLGYWKFDENVLNSCGVNTDTCDASADYDLMADDDATTVSNPGKFGNSATFDGGWDRYCTDWNDNGSCDDVNPLDFNDTDDFSISLWFNRDTFVNDEVLVAKRHNTVGVSGYKVYIDASGDQINLSAYDGTDSCDISSNTQFTTSEWNHMIVTFDQDSALNTRVYINGEEDTASAGRCTQSEIESIGSLANNDNLSIGSNSWTSFPYQGDIDEVRIYNRALSPAEVQNLYEWAPGPVGYWDFNDNTGTVAYDKSGNGNNGSFTGSPAWSTGKFGSATHFDGDTSDRINANGAASLIPTTQGTISAWVNPSSSASGGYREIMDVGKSTPSHKVELYQSTSDNIKATYVDGNDHITLQYLTTVSFNQWYYATVTWGSNTVNLYVDGVLRDSNTPTTSTDQFTFVRIGNDAASNAFDGSIDEVRIYNYARTQEQIIEDMNAGHPAPGSPVGSPVLHLKLDEGYGDTANDSSPQNNDGNLAAGTTCPQSGDSACPSWTNNGKIGKALDFDTSGDTDDYIYVGSPASLDNLPALSASLWFYSHDGDNGGQFLNKRGAGGTGWRIAEGGTKGIEFRVDYSSTDLTQFTGNNTFTANSWNHLIVTWDGSTNAGNIHFYLNGAEIALSAGSDGNVTREDDNTNSLEIGRYPSGKYYDGLLDEIKIFNFALTADQVKIEYNQGSATVFGSLSTDSNLSPSSSQLDSYCPPGQGSSCTAPVGEWLFDEKTGSNAQDTSENGNTGSITGAIWRHAGDCRDGACLHFDRIDDYVVLNSEDGNFSFDEYTISAWIYQDQDAAAAIYNIIDNRDGIDDGYRMYVNSQTDVIYCEYNGTVSLANVVADTWYYVVCAADSSNQYLYINGVLADSDPITPGINETTDMRFGSQVNVATDLWPGIIDNVRIFEYARTPAQIAWEYNRGGPVGWWKLDECQGNTAYDSSGNGNNGTISAGDTSGSNDSVGTCSSGAGDEMWDNGTTGKRNASLDFDGAADPGTDYVEITDTDLLSFTNGSSDTSLTFATWVYRKSTSNHDIFSKNDVSGSFEYRFRIQGSDELLLELTSATGNLLSTSVDTIPLYEWVHLAVTYDGSENTSGLKLYYNGRLMESTNTEGGVYIGMSNTDENVCIGCRWNGDTTVNRFTGQIDDVRIYNYTLTQQQINDIYNSGAVRFGP